MKRLLALLTATTAFLALATPAHAAPPAEFGSEGSGAGQILEPRGIAVDQSNGDLYIADRNNSRIDKFGPNGEFLFAFGWGVADGSTGALQTCTTTCFAGLPGAGTGQLNEDEGIAVDNSGGASQGDVYVYDIANHRVEKFGPAGEFILMFGGEVDATTLADVCLAGEQCQAGVAGTGPGEFEVPFRRGIAVGPTGTVYVADLGRVQTFGPGGVVQSEFTIPGGGFGENLAVDSTGDLYLKSSELAGVRKYEATGTELPTPRDEAGGGEQQAITIGAGDELFVNDFQSGAHHLLGFDPAGKQISSFDSGSEAQDGSRGIAYSTFNGAIYVLNSGVVRIVTSPPPGPFVLPGSESATEIFTTSATLGATLNPEGPEATSYFFEYGETAAYGEATVLTALSGGEFEDQAASASLSGLAPRRVYHYRVVAENAAAEVTRGPDQSFETLPPVSIVSTSVSKVTADSALLETTLNPHGLPTHYRFEYGTTPGYGLSVPVPDGDAGSGSVEVSFAWPIQDLAPSTTYHYRVVAENELGEGLEASFGPDRTFTTQGAAASILPDDRVWEMVTPPNKFGSPLEPLTEEGGAIQAAVDGSAFASVALGPLGPLAQGVRSPEDSQWLSRRGPAGWSTEDITTPHEEVSLLATGHPSEYQLFAEDLRAGLVAAHGKTPLSPLTTEKTPYRREADGSFVPLVVGCPAEPQPCPSAIAAVANALPGVRFGGEEIGETFAPGVEFVTATPDLGAIVLKAPQALTPGFEPGFEPEGKTSIYELTGGKLRLVSILPNEEPAAEAGLASSVGRLGLNMRGAVSSNGNRVVFETGGSGLYLRDVGLAQTVRLDLVQPAAAGGAGVAEFQAASADGSKVFFTDASRLTTDATSAPGKPDLYMCEIEVSGGQLGCALSDLSVDPNLGESADLFGGPDLGTVSAVDASGAHVYFAADGVLTNTANAAGEHAVPGACNSPGEASCNLYVYDTATRQVSLVAVLSTKDDPVWDGPTSLNRLGNLTARSSPNGDWFAFMSRRPLTGYDNRDAASGERDEEVFLSDSVTGALSCASCNPTGARPHGVFDAEGRPGLLVDHPDSWGGRNSSHRWLAASIPGWTLGPSIETALYQSRYLSDSGRLFFDAADALEPQDTNGVMDVYQYEPPGVGSCTATSPTFGPLSGGCVDLISSGTSAEESAFLDASQSGDDVFFLTASQLAPTDVDRAFDVYDAAVGGSVREAPPALECSGEACQPSTAAAGEATPGTSTFVGPANPKPKCAKGKVRKGGKCVKKKSHKKTNHKKSKKRHAKVNRGGAK